MLFRMAALVVALILCGTLQCAAAEFTAITAETLYGSTSTFQQSFSISAISGDGTVIGGSRTLRGLIFDCATFDCGTSGFLYSLKDQRRLDLLQSPRTDAYIGGFGKGVRDLSYDGQKALVLSEYRHYESFIAGPVGGRYLRDPVIIGEYLIGTAMSSDGRTVVGRRASEAFLWTESDGLQPFPDLPSNSSLFPTKISGDGNTVVLKENAYGFPPLAIFTVSNTPLVLQIPKVSLWSEATGFLDVEPLAGHTLVDIADLTDNASIAVGSSSYYPSPSSFTRISAPTVWRGDIASALPMPDGFDSGSATAVSADGSVAVGTAIANVEIQVPLISLDPFGVWEPPTDNRAVLWRDGELDVLQDLLAEKYGLAEQLEGWYLTAASAISADGQTIAGSGVDPQGNSAAWVVTLSIPEPSTAVLMITLLCLTMTCVRFAQIRPTTSY